MQRCTACGVAPVEGHDRHCFYCGVELRGVELELSRDLVEVDGRSEGAEYWVEGRVHNTGQLPQRVRLLAPEAPWMSFFNAEGAQLHPTGWYLAPGARAAFRVRVHPEASLVEVLEAMVRAEAEENDAVRPRLLRVLPQPRAVLVWRPDTCLHMIESAPPLLRGEVVLETAVPAHVMDVVSKVGWAEASWVDGEVQVSVVPGALRTELGDDRPASVTLRLEVRLSKPLKEVVSESELALEWPGLLQLSPQHHQEKEGGEQEDPLVWKLPAGRLHLFDVEVANRGGRQVVVHAIRVSDPGGRVYLAEPHIPAAPSVVSPGGAPLRLRLAGDLTGVNGDVVMASVALDTDDEEAPTQTWELRIVPLPRRPLNGVVGLDFGTTNSCLAVWSAAEPGLGFLLRGLRSAGETRPLPEPVLASNVLYHHRLADGLRTCEVGLINLEDHPHSKHVLEAIKRELGRDQPEPVFFVQDRQGEELRIEEIAGDIVRRLLAGAEEVLGRKIGRCTLTHPVGFAPRHLHTLLEVVKGAGVEVASLLPEPVAAALEFVVSHGRALDLGPEYAMLVLDIGGGTTDLAAVEVRDTDGPQGRIIAPILRGVRGLRWAGGEDITWAMIERWLTTADEWDASASGEDESASPLHMDASLRESILIRDRGVRRRAAGLFAMAEDEKKQPGTLRSRFRQSLEDFDQLVDAFLAEHGVIELARETLDAARFARLDVILLVGQSWAIPRLREAVAGAFPDIPVYPPEGATAFDLKKSVALGACRAGMFGREGLGYELVVDGLKPLTNAHFGIRLADSRGRLRFHPVVPASTEVANSQVEEDGWHPVSHVGVWRGSHHTVVQNSGVGDELEVEVNGLTVSNPEIEEIGVVTIPSLPEEISDAILAQHGRLEMRFTEQHEVEVRLKVNERSWRLDWDAVEGS
jgi:Hsp70 protein